MMFSMNIINIQLFWCKHRLTNYLKRKEPLNECVTRANKACG